MGTKKIITIKVADAGEAKVSKKTDYEWAGSIKINLKIPDKFAPIINPLEPIVKTDDLIAGLSSSFVTVVKVRKSLDIPDSFGRGIKKKASTIQITAVPINTLAPIITPLEPIVKGSKAGKGSAAKSLDPKPAGVRNLNKVL